MTSRIRRPERKNQSTIARTGSPARAWTPASSSAGKINAMTESQKTAQATMRTGRRMAGVTAASSRLSPRIATSAARTTLAASVAMIQATPTASPAATRMSHQENAPVKSRLNISSPPRRRRWTPSEFWILDAEF